MWEVAGKSGLYLPSWTAVTIAVCGFSSVNQATVIDLHYMYSKRWIIFLKIFNCVHIKKESHLLYISDCIRVSKIFKVWMYYPFYKKVKCFSLMKSHFKTIFTNTKNSVRRLWEFSSKTNSKRWKLFMVYLKIINNTKTANYTIYYMHRDVLNN